MGQLSYSPVEAVMCSINLQNRVYSETSLPLDIIVLISEELLAMECTSELAALSLLGNRYIHAIQRRLFRRISISTYDRYARLMRTLQSGGGSPERCHALASMVRRLSIVLNPYPPRGGSPLYPCHLFNLYDNLPMLEFIDLNEAPMSGLGRSLLPVEEDLHLLATLNHLRSVTLTGHLGPVGRSMLIGLPCLEELRLFGDVPASLFSLIPPRSGHGIRQLTWGAAIPPTLQWIRWMFDGSEDVTGGELVLLGLPHSEAELDDICRYASRRNMFVRVTSSVAAG